MKKELSKKQLELFDLILRELSTAIKNSVLYATDHPLFSFSIKNLKASLEKWLSEEGELDIGISQDNILLGGVFVRQKDDVYSEVASYLHSRGIVAISVFKEIDTDELTDFFKFIKND
ncbi:MAG: hypothetical protein U9R44_00610, partial [Candidatus Omnitrophota bacterium]|nr:hypothetical protein [Candidatus Omnitrophota bacterium]